MRTPFAVTKRGQRRLSATRTRANRCTQHGLVSVRFNVPFSEVFTKSDHADQVRHQSLASFSTAAFFVHFANFSLVTKRCQSVQPSENQPGCPQKPNKAGQFSLTESNGSGAELPRQICVFATRRIFNRRSSDIPCG